MTIEIKTYSELHHPDQHLDLELRLHFSEVLRDFRWARHGVVEVEEVDHLYSFSLWNVLSWIPVEDWTIRLLLPHDVYVGQFLPSLRGVRHEKTRRVNEESRYEKGR